jgi:DNA-binding response OmpR family regulator
MNKEQTVLLVEDSEGLAHIVRRLLTRAGFAVDVTASGEEALDYLKDNQPLLLLLDYYLPDMEGGEVVTRLRAQGNRVPFIFMTGSGEPRIVEEMMGRGALGWIAKDDSFMECLTDEVTKAFETLGLF